MIWRGLRIGSRFLKGTKPSVFGEKAENLENDPKMQNLCGVLSEKFSQEAKTDMRWIRSRRKCWPPVTRATAPISRTCFISVSITRKNSSTMKKPGHISWPRRSDKKPIRKSVNRRIRIAYLSSFAVSLMTLSRC